MVLVFFMVGAHNVSSTHKSTIGTTYEGPGIKHLLDLFPIPLHQLYNQYLYGCGKALELEPILNDVSYSLQALSSRDDRQNDIICLVLFDHIIFLGKCNIHSEILTKGIYNRLKKM